MNGMRCAPPSVTSQDATRRSDPVAAASPAASPSAAAPFRGYFRPEDLNADRWVHLVALILCILGIPFLLENAGQTGVRAALFACVVYSMTLVLVFACSAALYHIRLRIERRRLRQFDHAAIFLLIAGTQMPFTTVLLNGWWDFAITVLIWAGALGGAIYKLSRPLSLPGFSAVGYLLAGGTVLVGLVTVLHAADPVALTLILLGLAIYVSGAVIRRRRTLRYRNTIWHSMVAAAASCHYAAILHTVTQASGGFR